MMRVIGMLAVLGFIGCGSVPDTPTAPDVITPAPVVTPTPVRPDGPQFALELRSSGATHDGQLWAGTVSVIPAAIARPDLPVRVRVICPSDIRDFPGMASGSAPFTCRLPVGTSAIRAEAILADGRVYPTSLDVQVSAQPAESVPLTYRARTLGAPPVLVHELTVFAMPAAFRYLWTFGDGGTDATTVPITRHAYGQGRHAATVTIVREDGRILGSGSVLVTVD